MSQPDDKSSNAVRSVILTKGGDRGLGAANAMTAVGLASVGGFARKSGQRTMTQGSRARGRRKKLWDIDPNMFCSIVGTCLTLDDLRAIAKKLGLKFPPGVRDYELHGYFVREAGKREAVGRLMQKKLERRHQNAVNQFAKLSSAQDMEAFWDANRKAGNIPGPYWALMTHSEAHEDLISRAFGEVHMLSHMVGASNRVDLIEKSKIEVEHCELAKSNEQLRQRLNQADRRVQDLQRKLAEEQTAARKEKRRRQGAENRLQQSEQSLERLLGGGEFSKLNDQILSLRRQVSRLERRAHAAEALAEERKRAFDAVHVLNGETGLEDAVESKDDSQQHIDLAGRRIVYVGGRSGAMGHFRSIVEKANGVFIHHDGGLEDKIARLPGTLVQGDTVICPVDCVSHSACQLAKKFCKRHDCPFVLLRSSGLSSFVNALSEIAERNGDIVGGAN